MMNGKLFRRCSLMGIVVCLLAMPAVVSAQRPDAASEEAISELVKKLYGDWVGLGACDGELTVRADGTYERRYVGPAGEHSAGRWQIRWDALPPTLVLTCTSSEAQEIELARIVELDQGLVLDYGGSRPTGYERPEIDKLRALQISEKLIATRESWLARATYEVRSTKDGWAIIAWREPRTPGGHRLIELQRDGKLLRYVRGR